MSEPQENTTPQTPQQDEPTITLNQHRELLETTRKRFAAEVLTTRQEASKAVEEIATKANEKIEEAFAMAAEHSEASKKLVEEQKEIASKKNSDIDRLRAALEKSEAARLAAVKRADEVDALASAAYTKSSQEIESLKTQLENSQYATQAARDDNDRARSLLRDFEARVDERHVSKTENATRCLCTMCEGARLVLGVAEEDPNSGKN